MTVSPLEWICSKCQHKNLSEYPVGSVACDGCDLVFKTDCEEHQEGEYAGDLYCWIRPDDPSPN